MNPPATSRGWLISLIKKFLAVCPSRVILVKSQFLKEAPIAF
jgi:hypothetical protein